MLKAIAENIWVVDHDHFMMGIHFPGRMTVIRLSDGKLWLCSAVPIDDPLAAALAELGPVAAIVAPNRLHHVYLPAAVERYPEAAVFGAPGLAAKRQDVDFTDALSADAPAVWSGQLEQVLLRAVPTFSEVVFFHRASNTLITTDLFMNAHEVKGAFSRFVYWVEGCYQRPNVPRLIKFLTKDRAVMQSDLKTIAGWPIERLIMAHGEIVTDDAGAVVRRGFSSFGVPDEAAAAEV